MRGAAVALAALAAGCVAPRPPVASPGVPVVVAHFGDSTCSTGYLRPEERVDAVLQAMLRERYPRQDVRDVNVARPRETIRHLLDARWPEVRAALPHADVALVRYGQNDLGRRTPAEFRTDVESLCDRLAADYPGVHVVLETNTWVDPANGGNPVRNAQYEAYWDVVRTVSRARALPLVDVAARRRREAAAGDGDLSRTPGDVHPNARGVALVADEELRTIVAAWPDRLPSARR